VISTTLSNPPITPTLTSGTSCRRLGPGIGNVNVCFGSVYVVRKFKVRDDRALMLSEPECERLLFAAISGIALHPNRHAVTIPL